MSKKCPININHIVEKRYLINSYYWHCVNCREDIEFLAKNKNSNKLGHFQNEFTLFEDLLVSNKGLQIIAMDTQKYFKFFSNTYNQTMKMILGSNVHGFEGLKSSIIRLSPDYPYLMVQEAHCCLSNDSNELSQQLREIANLVPHGSAFINLQFNQYSRMVNSFESLGFSVDAQNNICLLREKHTQFRGQDLKFPIMG